MGSLRRTLLLPVLVAVALAGPAAAPAQPPDDEWRTLELPHFRVHYPAASEEWARRAAARLEAVRERLIEEIGYAPPQVVDVIVADPLSRPNGSAWPLLGNPRMVLWTTPPAPSSILGSYRDWGELVALHEDVHLVHLLRPSRNRLRDRLGRLLPAADLGPIAHRAPRWVTEGYATLLEGRLTGAGRPHGGLRAAVLRQRARAGRLPGYGALGAGDDSWLGDSMAYLAGSAYLEWLEERAGPGALRDLWARMTARRDRSFDEAFRGVFGDVPAELYGRFTAELTWRAMEAERRLGGEANEVVGELWADLSRGTGAPAVSPDGLRIAAVLAGEPGDGAPPRLVVWETAVDEEAEARWRDERERIARDDPDDVAAVRSAPPAREVVATLPTFDGRAPADPRWTDDGALLFWALGPGPDGVDRADLYRWRVDAEGGGAVDRLTRGADLRYPEPLAGGSGERAIAVRSRHGLSQLVAVDLATGAATALTETSAAEVWATPRVDPSAGGGPTERLAAMLHRDGRWRLVVAELPDTADGGLGALTEIETPAGATVADPAWGPDHTLYAATGSNGFVDLSAWRLGAGTEAASPLTLTRTLGAALAPAPAPDGSGLYYLSLEHDGLDLRRLELPGAIERAGDAQPDAGLDEEELALLVPAVAPPQVEAVPDFAAAGLPDDRPYGVGPLTATPLVGLAATSGAQAFEAGVAVGDPVGRLDALLLGSLGRAGALEGATLAAAWRGWPIEVSGQLFAVREEPSAHDGVSVADRQGGSASILDRDRFGLWAAGTWRRAFAAGGMAARLGLHGERIEPEVGIGGPDHTVDQRAATLSGAFGWTPSRGRWRLPLELAAGLQEGESELGGDSWSWRRGALRAALGVGRGSDSLTLGWSRHGSDDLRLGFEQFQVGGLARSLLPGDVDFARIEAPALPAGTLVGDEHESQRVELRLDALPVPLFWERHRVWGRGGEKSDAGWLSLAGIEIEGSLPPMPILGLPGARWTAGAAWVLEDPIEDGSRLADPEGASLEDEIRLWGGLVWRP
jgi:hypothetical protein